MKDNVKDPRTQGTLEADIRPIVASGRRTVPIWLPLGVVILGGILLFITLDAQRRTSSAPTTQPRTEDTMQVSSALPPLYILPEPLPSPPPPLPAIAPVPAPAQQTVVAIPAPQQPPPPITSSPVFQPSPSYSAAPSLALPSSPLLGPQQQPISSTAALVIDSTAGPSIAETEATTATSEASPVQAVRLRRRATTVPQGTLIPATLETALDSTRPGHARAIVSRDVTGFDGSRVLIPRGSRLFGEYQADVGAGQNRALVQWTRLVRPDGVTIALDSPAADAQGRAGIQGRVNTHFLARFSEALLQTTLNVGASLAGQSLNRDGGVVVALPGVQGAVPSTTGSRSQPTLRVEAGVSVTVFVARDLEFSSGEIRR